MSHAMNGADHDQSQAGEIAEQWVLGALLNDTGAIRQIDLRPDEFSDTEHRAIYSAIVALGRMGQSADALTVFEHARHKLGGESASGFEYLGQLSHCVESSRNIKAHAALVRKAHQCRDLAKGLRSAFVALETSGDPQLAADMVAACIRDTGVIASDAANWPWAGPEVARVGTSWIHTPQQPEAFVIDGRLPRNAVAFIGTGGTGKSTFLMWVGVHIILGHRVFGAAVLHPGPVVYITAEDDTKTVQYRLREICKALELSAAEWEAVSANFYIEDVSAVSVRLVNPVQGAYEPSPAVNRIIDAYRDVRPALVIADPNSLLGPAEENAPGGMSEMMRTARHMSRALDCAVKLVHHETKAGAREGTQDQHAGRGSSAFADNARAVFQFVPLKALTFPFEGRMWSCPQPWSQEELDAGNLMALFTHKLSHARRDRTPFVIRRNGFHFEAVPALGQDGAEVIEARTTALQGKIVAHVIEGLCGDGKVTHSRRSLTKACMARGWGSENQAEAAIDDLVRNEVLLYLPLPKGLGHGAKKEYLVPSKQPELML